MFDQEDSEQGIVIGVLFGVIALVIALVIGLGVYKLRTTAVQPAEEIQVVEIVWMNTEEVGDVLAQVYFGAGEVKLPENIGQVVDKVSEIWLVNPQAVVLLSAVEERGENGSAASPAEVVNQRVIAVRDALAVVGIPTEQILIRKSVNTTDDGSAAGRIDIRVQ